MTRKEADRLFVGDWVEVTKTGKGFEIARLEKTKDTVTIFNADGNPYSHKVLRRVREEIEYFNAVTGYNFTRNRWEFDNKAYLDIKNKCWRWLWNNEPIGTLLDRQKIDVLYAIAEKYPEKEFILPKKEEATESEG